MPFASRFAAPYLDMIEQQAHITGLDRALVEAVILQESQANPYAYNPEPAYPYQWDVHEQRPFRTLFGREIDSKYPPADFYDLRGYRGVDADHEWWGQQASWGLMQIMGAVAREKHFRNLYLPSLCDPYTNIELGCIILAGLKTWSEEHGGDIWRAVAAYNGGMGGWTNTGPQNYARKVRDIYTEVLTWK